MARLKSPELEFTRLAKVGLMVALFSERVMSAVSMEYVLVHLLIPLNFLGRSVE